MTASPEHIERLLGWTTRLRSHLTDMPWAEPPPQPTPFDRRDAAEADDFDRLCSAAPATPPTPHPASGSCAAASRINRLSPREARRLAYALPSSADAAEETGNHQRTPT